MNTKILSLTITIFVLLVAIKLSEIKGSETHNSNAQIISDSNIIPTQTQQKTPTKISDINESKMKYKDGDAVTIYGQQTCLNKKNVKPGEPTTTECAMGFVDISGNYYGILFKNPNYQMGEGNEYGRTQTPKGIFRNPDPISQYEMVGVIEVN